MQDVQLTSSILAGNLKARAINKVQAHTVRKFLYLYLRRVWRPEITQVVSLDSAGLLVLARGRSRRRRGSYALNGAEN